MEFSDRIKLICKELGISVRDFEQKCGLSNGYVNNIKKGISLTKLDVILNCYPDINRDWLVYEEGSMFKTANEFNDDPARYEKAESDERCDDNSMMAIIVSQQNTIERLTKIIDTMMAR